MSQTATDAVLALAHWRNQLPLPHGGRVSANRAAEANRMGARCLENKLPDDEGWGGGEILARYESGVMLFLLILTVTIVALLVWLGAYLISV
jgi:hypothetical protein